MSTESFNGASGRTWTYDTDKPLGPPGGFGRVFKGEGDDGSPIAVKVVDVTQRVLPERLLEREADINDKLAGVDASYLLPVIDAGRTPDAVMLVMPRAGGSLAGWLETRRTVDEGEALSILVDITVGLRELHQAGVIHRDLKPGNVLRHDGRWTLADFGIARDTELGTQVPTFLGAGTDAYKAPETWLGKSPSPKTDLYSLGCLAVELFAGAPPFSGPDPASYRQQHLEDVPNADAVSPPLLQRLVLRLLSKNPAERQQDARAVEESLRRLGDRERSGGADLADLALAHARERATVDAAQSAASEEAARQAELHLQGQYDLHDIITEAWESIHDQLPEVEHQPLANDGAHAALVSPDADEYIELTESWHQPGDSLLIVGTASIRNRRQSTSEAPFVAANVAYEKPGDEQYRWMLYRFIPSGAVKDYPFGHGYRPHGLEFQAFADQRKYMLGGLTHIFRTERRPLLPTDLVDLYAEALAWPKEPGRGS
jgi:serine/threonine-protein kinase